VSEYNITTAKQLIDEVVGSELYPQFIAQLQKDLNRAGIDYIIENKRPNDLFSEIVYLLTEKLQNAFNEYLNLLYAVDVSEAKIRSMDSENSVDIAEYATYLILKREWQKVWYRNKR
jgi:flavorubredoxin